MPGHAMPAQGLADLKRRRRLASRDLLSNGGGSPVKPRVTIDPGAVRTPRVERSRSPDQDRKDPGREPWLSNPVVAEPVPAVPEQESCCARLLRWLPRTLRCSVNASIDLGDADVS